MDRKSDWQGKPVSVGEKILTIADPNEIEFLNMATSKRLNRNQ